ncbi:unnamed protein product [Prunus armeniaca]|uniref:Transcription factor CBF/NF-Y/archaeal histone domain-containing protein n=1 Tax=Prunus armeniaca TaxID=36596 RepID=A0A6J5X4V6_PRUAR|nr:unnamed protein product [Prunus armeniaca]CAB4305988.1 unnamed protein product [Prunus armeniaca]
MMKKGLPGNAKISKDAKETVQECVSEFISFTTGEASGIRGASQDLFAQVQRDMEDEKTAGTGMARQLLYADHHPHEYHDQRQREQLQHLHAPGMNMYGGMMMGHQHHHHHQGQGHHPYLYGSGSGPSSL